jgi:3-methyladenine DNA glycosylase AlkD
MRGKKKAAHSVLAILKVLRRTGSAKNRAGMARFGITSKKVFGVGVTPLRALARRIGKDHKLALELWSSGWLETRILAALIDDPHKVTSRQMDRWGRDFDNWAVCDTCCSVLFYKTPFAYAKVRVWGRREDEFVKRAGYALMAVLAVHDKSAPDSAFRSLFPLIKRGSTDNRNFVRKAVNWALRQIGKRNKALHKDALRLAVEILRIGTPSARWIARDAVRELSRKKPV